MEDSKLVDYKKASKTYAVQWNAIEEKHKRRVANRIAEMTIDDHIELLKEIVTGHLGGKSIKIRYRLPITAETSNALKEYFHHEPWHVKVKQYKPGITLSNYPVTKTGSWGRGDELANSYTEYSYRRYRIAIGSVFYHGADVEVRRTTVDFLLSDSDLGDDLILFSRHIGISVFDLLIPRDQICSPGTQFRQHLPMSYNETFELPE